MDFSDLLMGGVRCDQGEHLADRGELFRLEDALDRKHHQARAVGVLLAFQDRKVALDGRCIGEGLRQATPERSQMVEGGLGGQGIPDVVVHSLVGVALDYRHERC